MPPEAPHLTYQRLWDAALARFATGTVEADPFLKQREDDHRYGLSLVMRPAPEVVAALASILAELRSLEPDMHFYRPDELHVTILTLITTVVGFNIEAVPVDRYRAIFARRFADAPPVAIRFQGLTASPGAVMVQGFPLDNALNELRTALRADLTTAGLGKTMDGRYKSTAAHMTCMRFPEQPRDLPRLVAALTALRDCPLGISHTHTVEFVHNDWYMSHDKVQVLARYRLEAT